MDLNLSYNYNEKQGVHNEIWNIVMQKEFMFDINLNDLWIPEEDMFLAFEPFIGESVLNQLMSIFNQLTLDQMKIQAAIDKQNNICTRCKKSKVYYKNKHFIPMCECKISLK